MFCFSCVCVCALLRFDLINSIIFVRRKRDNNFRLICVRVSFNRFVVFQVKHAAYREIITRHFDVAAALWKFYALYASQRAHLCNAHKHARIIWSTMHEQMTQTFSGRLFSCIHTSQDRKKKGSRNHFWHVYMAGYMTYPERGGKYTTKPGPCTRLEWFGNKCNPLSSRKMISNGCQLCQHPLAQAKRCVWNNNIFPSIESCERMQCGISAFCILHSNNTQNTVKFLCVCINVFEFECLSNCCFQSTHQKLCDAHIDFCLVFKIEKQYLQAWENIEWSLMFIVCIVVIWSSTLTEHNVAHLYHWVSLGCGQSTHYAHIKPQLHRYLQYNVIVAMKIKLKSSVCGVRACVRRDVHLTVSFCCNQQRAKKTKCILASMLSHTKYIWANLR